MAKMDEFKEERAAIKDKPFKERLAYFIEYYGARTILIAVCVIALFSIIIKNITAKDIVLYAAMYNTMDLRKDGAYAESFKEYAGLDTKRQDVILDETMYIDLVHWDEYTNSSIEKTMLFVTSQELDVVMAQEFVTEYFAYFDFFMDVRDYLTPEQLEQYKDSFYYIDRKVMEEQQEPEDSLYLQYEPDYPDPRKPELMTDPVPVGIYMGDTNQLAIRSSYYIDGENPVFCVLVNSKNATWANRFFEFVMQK